MSDGLARLRDLRNEIDCRIEHGAETGGHLEFVRQKLDAILADETDWTARVSSEEADRIADRLADTPPPRITSADFGAVFESADGALWRLLTYTEQPTATLQRVGAGLLPATKVRGVVGSSVFAGFRRLVPDPEG